jgi:type I restriction enzyme S subunit
MRAMKQSGVPWIGEIPEHWQIKRLKYIADVVLGKMLCNEDNGGYFLKPYLKSKNLQWLKLDVSDVEEMWFSQNELDLYRLKKGDLVLSEGGEVGKTCIWNNELEECYIQNSAHKVTINNQNCNRYFLYLFFIYGNTGGFNSIVRTISISHLTKDKLVNIDCVSPSLIEQTAIANFLDNECQRIDALIETEETIIFELKEYKKSFIQKAITENSANWERHRFTTFFYLGKGLSITKADLQDEGIPVVSYGEIHSKYGRELNPDIHPLKYVKDTYLKSDKACLLQYGDFVFADTSEDLEGSGNFTFLNSHTPVFAGYHTIIARPKIEVDFLFLSFLCDSYKFREQIQSQVVGIKVFSITKDLLKNVNLWLPPLPEQKAIAEYLDKKTSEVDTLILIKQNKITQLKEYKKTLIYEYVTGKKEVPA